MTTDYSTRIDAETWAFIDRMNGFYPPETADLPIERNREIYDRMSRSFASAYPDGVSAVTSAIDTPLRRIPVRLYRLGACDGAAVILYFHGGGFILGGLDSHDDICADLCKGTGYGVVSVDYRLAPEHKDLAAFEDAMAAFEWAATAFDQPIVLAGESAGGTLAAAVAHHSRGHLRAPVGQVLIYPSLGGDIQSGSYVTHADAPMLTVRDLALYHGMRTGGVDVSGDPRYWPLADPDFSGLPPAVLFTAECDPLSSDGETYRDRMLANGGQARWREEPGLPHGYLRARHTVKRAGNAFAAIVKALEALGRGGSSS
ncbi:MAG: alpha/beta hydrolase [Phyllobacterium sp.]